MSLASSRLFGAFSLADLTLYLAAFTLLMTCFTWSNTSLFGVLAVALMLLATPKQQSHIRCRPPLGTSATLVKVLASAIKGSSFRALVFDLDCSCPTLCLLPMMNVLYSIWNILYVALIDFAVLCIADAPLYFILPLVTKANEQAQAVKFWNRSEIRFFDKAYLTR